MKLIGVLILITASTGTGIALSFNLRRKCEICAELEKFCDMMLSDLEYTVSPIGTLLERAVTDSRHLDFITKKSIINKYEVQSPLKHSVNNEISSFLYSLGKSDVNSQIKLIKAFREYIRGVKKDYLFEYDKHRKLYLSFGFFIGTALALILV